MRTNGDGVVVYDTTMRDGEQAPGMAMPPDAKVRMAGRLVELGVDVMEAGFPASSESDVVAIKRICANYGRDVVVAALCRAMAGDVDAAAYALCDATRSRVHVFVPTSDIHISAKFESSRAAVVDAAAGSLQRAAEVTDDLQFGLEDATRADPDFLAELIRLAIGHGATTITVADTVGYATPAEMHALLTRLRHAVPELASVVLSVHCHDDLGMAVANSLAGVDAGARQVECTINGIGERAGNAALEEVVMALVVRAKHFGCTVGVRTDRLCAASETLTEIVGVRVPPNKAVVGENAFAHEAGIHQQGVLANPLTYEIMTPESVGASGSRLVFGRHSGHHALRAILGQHGIHLSEGDLRATLAAVKARGDKVVPVIDLVAMARAHQPSDPALLPVPG